MPISIDFPKISDVPREVPLLAASRPNWNHEAVADLTRRFRLRSKPIDAGTWTIVRDKRAALEIYQNSHSFRFERLDVGDELRQGSVDPSSPDEAIDIAHGFVSEHPVRGARISEPTVTEHEVLVAERDSREPRRLLCGLQVNYRYAHDGFDLMGPGAKTQVTIGADGEMVAAYHFWRQLRAGGSVRTISATAAAERFASSELFADLDDRTASCEVTSVRFGYLTRPPTEPQGTLLPAYEFHGILSTESLPRYEFRNYVLGCDLEAGDVKWASRVGSLSERMIR